MLFERLSFAGLFSYSEESCVKLSERVVFVGPNNGGKSNIFKIIQVLSEALCRSKSIPASSVSQLGGDPHVRAEIALSDDEARTIVDFLRYGWDNSDRIHVVPLQKNLTPYFKNITVKIDWKRNPDGSGVNPTTSLQFPKCGFGLADSLSRGILRVALIDAATPYSPSRGVRLNEFLQSISSDTDPADGARSFIRSRGANHWPVPFDDHNLDKLRAEDKESALALLHKLGLGVGSTVSLPLVVGIMMSRRTVHAAEIRERAPITVEEEIERLAYSTGGSDFERRWNIALVDKIRAISTREIERLEPGGHNMAQFLLHLKNSSRLADIKRYRTIKEKFEELFDGVIVEPVIRHRRIDIGEGSMHIPVPEISITDGHLTEHVPLEQVGAGARNTLYLLTAVHGVNGAVVMLDEPGTNLHPQMLRRVMAELETSQADQILVVTHSVDLLRHEISSGASVVHVKAAREGHRKTSKVKVANLGDLVVEGRQLDLSMLFARRVILVEGGSDANVLLCLSRDMAETDPKYDLTHNNIVVVGVNGYKNFKKHAKLLETYDIPWVILADADSKNTAFKDQSVSWICKDKIDGNSPIYLLKGDLEDELRSIDQEAYRLASRGEKSKVLVALKFYRAARQTNAVADSALAKFLDRCASGHSRHSDSDFAGSGSDPAAASTH